MVDKRDVHPSYDLISKLTEGITCQLSGTKNSWTGDIISTSHCTIPIDLVQIHSYSWQ